MKEARQVMPYSLRMPSDMRLWFEERAAENNRSLNGELLSILGKEMIKSKLNDEMESHGR